MKKLLNICLLTLVSLFVLLSVHAQKFSLGVNGGISIPDLRSNGNNEISEGYKSRLAPVFGLMAEYKLNQEVAVKVLVNYAGQGGVRTGLQPVTQVPEAIAAMLLLPGTKLYANFKNEAILTYLEIPVLLKLKVGQDSKRIDYFIDGGPYIGFLLKAKQKTSGNSQFFLDKAGTMPLTFQGQPLPAQSFDANTDIKKDIESVNFGITGGGGMGVAINKFNALIFDVRAALGLKSIQKDTQANGKSHTGGLFLTLGFSHRFK